MRVCVCVWRGRGECARVCRYAWVDVSVCVCTRWYEYWIAHWIRVNYKFFQNDLSQINHWYKYELLFTNVDGHTYMDNSIVDRR